MTANVKCDTGVYNKTGTVNLYDGLTGNLIGSAGPFSSLSSPGSYTFTYAQQSSVVMVGLIATGQTNPFWFGYVLIPASGTAVCSDDYETALLAAGGGGGSGGTIENYITIPSAIAQQAFNPLQITCKNFCTLRLSLPGLGTISDRLKLWLTVKKAISDPDSAALIQIIEGQGLTIAAGITSPNSALASLTVTDETQGLVNLFIDKTIMALLPETTRFKPCVWGCKCELSNDDTIEPISGPMVVIDAVTQANNLGDFGWRMNSNALPGKRARRLPRHLSRGARS